MSDELIRLSRKFKFFLTFHFSLGFSIEQPADRQAQLRKLKDIANKLNEAKNSELKEYHWSEQEFDDNFPLSLRAKHGYLLRTGGATTDAVRKIIENRFSECPGVNLDSEDSERIEETVVYFDHGVGSINLLIKGELEKVEAIKCLRNLALNIQTDIQEAADKTLQTDTQVQKDKSLRVFDKWDDFRDSMRLAFDSSLYDIWGISLLGREPRGPTRVVGTGALLYIDGNSNLKPIDLDELRILLFDFAGLKEQNNIIDTIDKKGKIYLAQGYDGHITIVSNYEQETWLTNLWQFITDHYTIVRDLERYLYDWALSLSKEKQTPDPKYIRKVLKAIPRIELSIDLLTYESLPHNFAGKGYEKEVYQGIYDAWEKKQAVDSLNDKFKTLSARFNYYYTLLEQKAQERSNKIQTRINYFVFILTSITLASVLSDIFLFTYDGTSLIDIIKKAKIILIPTLIFAVVCWISVKIVLKEE